MLEDGEDGETAENLDQNAVFDFQYDSFKENPYKL